MIRLWFDGELVTVRWQDLVAGLAALATYVAAWWVAAL